MLQYTARRALASIPLLLLVSLLVAQAVREARAACDQVST